MENYSKEIYIFYNDLGAIRKVEVKAFQFTEGITTYDPGFSKIGNYHLLVSICSGYALYVYSYYNTTTGIFTICNAQKWSGACILAMIVVENIQ